jgi:hypothetical protein
LIRHGAWILSIALILSRLASIPQCDTSYSSNFPDGTPKVHFSGLSFSAQLGESFAKAVDERLLAPTLHNNVVDVSLDVAADLRAKAFPHCPLEGGSCILEPKGHTSVIEAPYRVMNIVVSLSLTAILIWW